MSEKVESAMPAELWQQILASPPDISLETSIAGVPGSETKIDMSTNRIGRHAVAAVALHGQPFGFTWDQLRRLRAHTDRLREKFQADWMTEGWDDGDLDMLDWHISRIEALLPPEVIE